MLLRSWHRLWVLILCRLVCACTIFAEVNCTDGDGCFFYNCPNYITEAKFYPILKSELDLMEQEMERLKFLGREREWQKQFIKYKYLKQLVESLEVQKDET